GAVWPRPSTWRGTIAKPAPVSATSETKSRRVIFFVIVVLRSAKASAERPLAYRLRATTKLEKRANPDVAKREHAGGVSLHADVAALGAAEFRPRVELRRCHFRFPVWAPELVLDHLDVVQPVLDVRAVGDDPRFVPIADRFEMTGGRRIKAVIGAGARE